MCGILGQINFDKDDTIDSNLLVKMRDSLLHRGPDGGGLFINKNIGLAFRRLSIIDLSEAGMQPMANEDETVWIVFNGEFYNFLDYRDDLTKKGHIFKSKTDTEVIIHLYEEYGIECLNKINGMFSLVIYDKNKNLLYLARDRFGVKPLFYYLDDKKIIFASEMKAILANNSVKRDINLNFLSEYFSFGYILSPNSIFKNIGKVKPSFYKIFDLSKNKFTEEKNYWQINFKVNKKPNFNEWQEEFIFSFNKAVRRRLISDVPLGVFLSGGIDSTSVVTFMNKMGIKNIKTFSIGFREEDFDETKYSRLVADKFSTDHYERIIEPDAIEILPKLTWYYDEPFDDSSALPTYYLSKITKEKVTVALSGDGGDELLAGYPRYRDFYKLNHYLRFLPEKIRNPFFRNIFKLYPEKFKGKRILFLLSLSILKSYREFMKNFNNSEMDNLFSLEVREEIKNSQNFDIWHEVISNSDRKKIDFVTGLQILDSQTYLPGDILTKVDIASMANSLEVRSPFLDYELWELVFSMPEDIRFFNYRGKYILKEVVKKIFGHDFVYRSKMGFGAPLNHWFKGKLENYSHDILLSSRFINRGFFDVVYIKKILSIHKAGHRDFSRKIWSLLFFENWCRNWLDK